MDIEELEVTLKMLNIGYYHTTNIFDKKAMCINIQNRESKKLEELKNLVQALLDKNAFKYYLYDCSQKYSEVYIRIDEE